MKKLWNVIPWILVAAMCVSIAVDSWKDFQAEKQKTARIMQDTRDRAVEYSFVLANAELVSYAREHDFDGKKQIRMESLEGEAFYLPASYCPDAQAVISTMHPGDSIEVLLDAVLPSGIIKHREVRYSVEGVEVYSVDYGFALAVRCNGEELLSQEDGLAALERELSKNDWLELLRLPVCLLISFGVALVKHFFGEKEKKPEEEQVLPEDAAG